MGLLDDYTLGFLSDLIAQHLYVNDVPEPQRRRWNLHGFTVVDDTAEEWLDITPGVAELDTDGQGSLVIAYDASGVTGDAYGVDINETAAPSGQSVGLRFRQNSTTAIEVIADGASVEVNTPTSMRLQVADTDKATITATECTWTIPVVLENNHSLEGEEVDGTRRNLAEVTAGDAARFGDPAIDSTLHGLANVDLAIAGTDRLVLSATECRLPGVSLYPQYDGNNGDGAIGLRVGDWITSGALDMLRIDDNDYVNLGGAGVEGVVLGGPRVLFDPALSLGVISAPERASAAYDIGILGQNSTSGAGGDAYLQGGEGTSTDGRAELRDSSGVARLIVRSDGDPEIAHTASGSVHLSSAGEFVPNAHWRLVGVITEDATETTIASIETAEDTVLAFRVRICMRSSTDGDSGCYVFEGCAENTGGTATIVGTPSNPVSEQQDAGWGASFGGAAVGVSTSGANLLVRVQGKASDTVTWGGKLEWEMVTT